MLVEVLKFNAPYAKQYYAELMQWLDPYSNGSTDGLCDLFIDHMQNHLDRSGLTFKLSELGIEESSLPILAQDAMLQTRLLQNNPRHDRSSCFSNLSGDLLMTKPVLKLVINLNSF